MLRHPVSLCAALIGALSLPSAGVAQTTLFEQRVRLGKPARMKHVKVVADEDGAVTLLVEGLRTPLPAQQDAVWELSPLALSAGRSVALLTAVGPGHRVGALLGARQGRAELLFAEELSLRGDPGERTGHRIETRDRDGDGSPDVLVGRVQEGVGLCGQPPALLEARRLDPLTGSLVPTVEDVLEAPPAPAAGATPLRALLEPPKPMPAPVIAALRPTGSSRRGGELDGQLVQLPRALVDVRADTGWAGEPGAAGRSQFVSFRWDASAWPIRALAVVFSPEAASPPAPSVRAPARLWLVGGAEGPLAVELPSGAASHKGRSVWIELAQPWHGDCLSIVLEGTTGAPGAALGLSEVIAFSELDFTGGAQALIDELVGDGERGAQAAEALASSSVKSAGALLQAWPRLSALGRARAVRVFGAQAQRDPDALLGLERALRQTDDDNLRSQALAGLVAAGPVGLGPLRGAVAERGPMGDATAESFARMRPVEAAGALLAALASPGGTERAALRSALALAARDVGAAERIASHFAQPHPTSVELAAALGLCAEASARPLALQLVLRNLARVAEFDDLWRLSLAAEALPQSQELDGWLEVLGKTDERWMLRVQVLQALAVRAPERAVRLARELSSDEYPRVRAAALGVLGRAEAGAEVVALRARRDRWPLVRASALDALAGSAARSVLRAALTDRSRAVRAAAVRGLTRLRDDGASAEVLGRLGDAEEWPEVQAEAIGYVEALCLHEASGLLAQSVRRGLAPNAWDPHVELAMRALQVMVRLGGESAATALALARAQPGGDKLASSLEHGLTSAEKCPLPR